MKRDWPIFYQPRNGMVLGWVEILWFFFFWGLLAFKLNFLCLKDFYDF